jgi:phage/plasmid primase-like uncharacterized protein
MSTLLKQLRIRTQTSQEEMKAKAQKEKEETHKEWVANNQKFIEELEQKMFDAANAGMHFIKIPSETVTREQYYGMEQLYQSKGLKVRNMQDIGSNYVICISWDKRSNQ